MVMKNKKETKTLELLGWDDNKIYFYDNNGKEFCINDYPDLLQKLKNLCAEYFKVQH
jgi:hypothetical protein